MGELLQAASSGDIAAVSKILASGQHPDSQPDANDWTAMFHAARGGHINVLQALLTAGANVFAVSKPFRNTALMEAAYWGQAEAVAVLLSFGSNPNATNIRGNTALIWGAEGGHVTCVEQLLAHSADVNIFNNEGKTAINVAKDRYIRDILKKAAGYPQPRDGPLVKPAALGKDVSIIETSLSQFGTPLSHVTASFVSPTAKMLNSSQGSNALLSGPSSLSLSPHIGSGGGQESMLQMQMQLLQQQMNLISHSLSSQHPANLNKSGIDNNVTRPSSALSTPLKQNVPSPNKSTTQEEGDVHQQQLKQLLEAYKVLKESTTKQTVELQKKLTDTLKARNSDKEEVVLSQKAMQEAVARAAGLQQQVDSLRAENEETHRKYAELQEKLAEMSGDGAQQRIASLERQLQFTSEAKIELEERVRRLEHEVSEERATSAKSQKRQEALKKEFMKIEALLSKVASMQEELDAVAQDKAKKEEELQKLKYQLQAYQSVHAL